MSWQDDTMIEQERVDALFEMGEAEWRDITKLTVEQAKELNKKAKLTCERETTSQTGGDDE